VGDKDPKTNRRAKDPINVGGNKNAEEESKVNKTRKNKTKCIYKNENMTNHGQGSQ